MLLLHFTLLRKRYLFIYIYLSVITFGNRTNIKPEKKKKNTYDSLETFGNNNEQTTMQRLKYYDFIIRHVSHRSCLTRLFRKHSKFNEVS